MFFKLNYTVLYDNTNNDLFEKNKL